MTTQLLKWMAECPIAESYRIHPSLLREIEELGCVTVTVVEQNCTPAATFLATSGLTLGGKPLEPDASIRPNTLQIVGKDRITPTVAIEFEAPVLV